MVCEDEKMIKTKTNENVKRREIALIGNPNAGKTTLFNRLTESHQRVGNWPGVTVEKKTGYCPFTQKEIKLEITDLPGIYSIEPRSVEEKIAYNHLVNETPDLVVNIVDATNLERNLYLTLQLKALNIPIIVALNIMDEVEKNGDKIDVQKLSEMLGMKVVPISAATGSDYLSKIKRRFKKDVEDGGIGDLTNEIIKETCNESSCENCCENYNENCCENYSKNSSESCCCPATEIKNESEEITVTTDMTSHEMYDLIEKVTKRCIIKGENKNLKRSYKIDKLLTNKWLGIPIFLLIMFLVFQISFGSFGSAFTEIIETFMGETLPGYVEIWFSKANAPEWMLSLVNDGILAGVGAVLSFLPQIVLLFIFLTIMEDTGYMARAAFIMDRLFEAVGLSGKSFIPMLMGFGCTVPAVMAARTLEDENDRKVTIIITPFMSCSAKLPIYVLFVGAFFASQKIDILGYTIQTGGIVMTGIYVLGVIVAILSALLLKKTILKGENTPFIMELPPYRIPKLTSTLMHVWKKVSGFIIRAGTVIFAMSILIWFIQTYDFSLTIVEDSATSILGTIGHAIAPVFEPLGFGNWRATVSLLTGFVAKEAVVATIEILYTPADFEAMFTPLTALSFMVFTLLYLPCLASLATMKQELNSWKWILFSLVYQTSVAYIAAFLVYRFGLLLGYT